jgi:hypothetical protein
MQTGLWEGPTVVVKFRIRIRRAAIFAVTVIMTTVVHTLPDLEQLGKVQLDLEADLNDNRRCHVERA